MGKYRIEIKRSAVKDLEKIPPKDLKKILVKIGDLTNDPRPSDSKKLFSEEKIQDPVSFIQNSLFYRR